MINGIAIASHGSIVFRPMNDILNIFEGNATLGFYERRIPDHCLEMI